MLTYNKLFVSFANPPPSRSKHRKCLRVPRGRIIPPPYFLFTNECLTFWFIVGFSPPVLPSPQWSHFFLRRKTIHFLMDEPQCDSLIHSLVLFWQHLLIFFPSEKSSLSLGYYSWKCLLPPDLLNVAHILTGEQTLLVLKHPADLSCSGALGAIRLNEIPDQHLLAPESNSAPCQEPGGGSDAIQQEEGVREKDFRVICLFSTFLCHLSFKERRVG